MTSRPAPAPPARRRISTRAVVGIVVGAILAGLCAVCGLAAGATHLLGSANPSTNPTAAAPPTMASTPPDPAPATIAAYIKDLNAIDPASVHGTDDTATRRAVRRGLWQCDSIRDWPTDRARLIRLTGERFTSPDHPDGFGLVMSGRILDVVHTRLCPAYPMG